MTTHTLDVPAPWLAPLTLRRELIAEGFSDRSIARMLADGRLARARRGAYVDGSTYAATDRLGRHALASRAVLRQAKSEASLSHGSALPWFGAPDYGLDLRTVDITRHDGRAGRREAGVRQHCGVLLDGDVVERHGISMVAPTRAAVEFTMTAGVEAGLVQVNHLLHTGQTTPADLAVMQARFDRWPGSLVTDVVLRLADGLLESVLESRFFHLCYRHSVPMPVPQYVVAFHDGTIAARLDFAWPKLGKWVETDGNVKYEKFLRPGERASDVVLREKRRESMVADMTGWSCLRIDNDDLRWPEVTVDRLMTFLLK